MYSMRVSKDISPIFIVVFLVLTHRLVGFLCFKWYLDFVVKSFDPGVIILWVIEELLPLNDARVHVCNND